MLLSPQELSKAWECLYSQKSPRSKKLQNLSEEDWNLIAELLQEEMYNLKEAQIHNQVH